jgi:peptidyl-prolyl cis-trans isomerase D
MINERVLLIAAKEAGMSISDKELQHSITQEPAFMKDGVFDKEVYLNRIKLNRMTPEIYESSKRQELLIDKMRHFIALSTDVTEMSSQIPELLGDEKMDQTINESLAREVKEKAVRSYLDGYKKLIKIKIYRELIT